MEFSAVASDLANALALAKSSVPTRTTIPLLNNVRISTKRGGIVIGSTDTMMDAVLFEQCEVISDGETTVNASILSSLVKSLPQKEMITFKMDDDSLRALMICGRSRFSLCCLPVDGFPVCPPCPQSAMSFALPVSKLTELFNATKRVTLAQAQDRYYFQGVCIHTTKEHLVMVASNGKQFAKIVTDKPPGFAADIAVAPIVPNEAVKAISTILAAQDREAVATVSFTEYRMWLTVGDVTFSAKLIEGKFLEYPRMIPATDKVSFRVKASDLATTLNRLSIVYSGTDIKAPVAVLSCAPGGGIEVAAGKLSGDHGQDFIAAEIVERMPQFGVSPQLLSELVGLWPSTAVLNVYSSNASAPILITSDEVPDVLQCVMPMNPGGQIAGTDAARKQLETEAA
jgi:DNA polymerase-3 subunit beta